MTGHYVVQGIFAVAGIIALLAAAFDWEWFFSTRGARSMTRGVTRRRARLFYALLGIIMIGMAVFFWAKV
ncbi:MAG: immunity 17 family protein [Mediterranea sp.]|jgi:hypothetical protein|nr:immunity 17 family protein [Mediterranea sp.]